MSAIAVPRKTNSIVLSWRWNPTIDNRSQLVVSSDLRSQRLVDLENQFLTLIAELDRDIGNPAQSDEHLTIKDEVVLACLDPIERAIMETPACTMVGLSVKARHLAYVES